MCSCPAVLVCAKRGQQSVMMVKLVNQRRHIKSVLFFFLFHQLSVVDLWQRSTHKWLISLGPAVLIHNYCVILKRHHSWKTPTFPQRWMICGKDHQNKTQWLVTFVVPHDVIFCFVFVCLFSLVAPPRREREQTSRQRGDQTIRSQP